jgi:hypothetical protein
MTNIIEWHRVEKHLYRCLIFNDSKQIAMKPIAIHKTWKAYFSGLLIIMLLVAATGANKHTLKEIALQKQAEGKYIAVYMHPANLLFASNASCPMDGVKPGSNHGKTAFDETLPDAYTREARNIANLFNEGLGTTSFKVVYAAELPMKTIKDTEDQVVDWSKTDYDVMINLVATPVYTTHSSPAEYTTDFELDVMLYVNELVPGQEALANMGSGITLATLKSDKVSHDGCLKSLQELKGKVAEPGIFSSILFDTSREALDKFVEKENRKYDKAVK